MGCLQCVQLQGSAGILVHKLSPDVPGLVQVVDGEVSDPRGEALVEPEVRPPAHRNQVPEPLVRQLVRHDVGDPLLGDERTVDLVDEEIRLPVGYEPPVLHGACGKVRQSDHVELGEGIGDAEVVGEEVQDLHADLQGEGALAGHTGAGVHPILHSLAGRPFNVLETTNRHGKEIGRHARGSLEPNHFAVTIDNFLLHWHVAQSSQLCRHSQRHVEGCLERGLVEAWQRSPAISRLMLRHRHVLLLALDQRLGPVEAAHVVVQLPVVADLQQDLPAWQLSLQLDRDRVLREGSDTVALVQLPGLSGRERDERLAEGPSD
mmetsp:Transcript_3611/g.8891  ORF Transcript_3611/g.8891 Transcript_3611/m.8891 type:complete len:319 (-) Transcript_3611:209-1165(-)